ncbi:MAG: hypothetical protein LIO95_09960 [Clostridiales bacterium]|nr:hypothetical protein [Clostridiales bacterium]
MIYIAEKNGKKFRVNDKQADVYRKAGYVVTEEVTGETATVKKAAKSEAEATETTD